MKSLILILAFTAVVFSADKYSFNFTSQGNIVFNPKNFTSPSNLCYFSGPVELIPQPNSQNITSFKVNGSFNKNATNCTLPTLTLTKAITNSTAVLLDIKVTDGRSPAYYLINSVSTIPNTTSLTGTGIIQTYIGNLTNTPQSQPFDIAVSTSAFRMIGSAAVALFALLF